jgi:hypothetical protein
MMVTVSFLMTNESTDWSLTSSEVLAVIYAVSYQNFKSVSSFMYSSLIIAYDFGPYFYIELLELSSKLGPC